MKRLSTISQVAKIDVTEYKLPKIESGEFIVDDSNFIPMSEAVRQLGASGANSEQLKNYYDFPNGKDNGMAVPITRTKNGKDIAEISSDIMDNIENMADKVQSEKARLKKIADFEKSISDIKTNSSVSTPPTE